MRLELKNKIPAQYNAAIMQEIVGKLQDQLNAISEGLIVATNNARTSVPTTGSYSVGDFVANSARIELGSGGSKYLVTGWICSVADPLAFVEARVLTGN